MGSKKERKSTLAQVESIHKCMAGVTEDEVLEALGVKTAPNGFTKVSQPDHPSATPRP